MNRTALRVALPCAILSAGLAGGEAWFRATRVTAMEGERAWKMPGARLVYRGSLGGIPQAENLVTWNSRGENDREWQDPALVVLGDSFVEAVQVPLASHMSTLLGGAKLACSGWGPIQEERRFAEARAWGWKPRRVVLVFCAANDIRNCRGDEGSGLRPPLWVLSWPLAAFSPGWGFGGEWDAAWGRAFWALGRLRATAPGLLVVLATPGDPNEAVRLWCAAEGVPCVDCRDAEAIPGDGHWSAAGHATASARVREAMGR